MTDSESSESEKDQNEIIKQIIKTRNSLVKDVDLQLGQNDIVRRFELKTEEDQPDDFVEYGSVPQDDNMILRNQNQYENYNPDSDIFLDQLRIDENFENKDSSFVSSD